VFHPLIEIVRSADAIVFMSLRVLPDFAAKSPAAWNLTLHAGEEHTP